MTDSTVLLYSEDQTKYIGQNLVYRDTSEYWTLNTEQKVYTDVFDGLQVEIDPDVEAPEYSIDSSRWINGYGTMRVTPTAEEGLKLAWNYNIVFTDNDSAYVGIAR